MPPALTPRERLGLAALLALRTAWMIARVYAEPQRLWNFEEAYNATVGRALTHGLLPELLTLQYRTFCGGCTVVSIVSAPALWLADSFIVWKLVAVAWTLATMIAAFFVLDRDAGRPAAWAAAAIFALPPLGGLDLSLMLWGNHQETALLGLSALLLVNRPIAAGLVLGASVWFSRTALYQVVVLAPLLLYRSGWRAAAGLVAGLALLAVPTASGDAGFYRMSESFGAVDWLERAQSLLAPSQLAKRLFHPMKELEPGAWVWLAAAATGLAARGRARVVIGWTFAWVAAYSLTTFPIFIVSARSPVNNIRYHGPWIFLLTLLIAIGVGRLWAWRRAAGATVLGAVLVVNALALARATWTPEPCVGAMTASWPAKFATVAGSRLSLDRLQAGSSDPRLDAALQLMYGFRRGEVAGDVPLGELTPYALRGLGLARATNATVSEWNTWFDGLDPATARELARGVALGRASSGPGSRHSTGGARTESQGRSTASAREAGAPRPSSEGTPGSAAGISGARPPLDRGDGRGDSPCWLCGEEGVHLLRECRDDHACVAAALAGAPEAAWVAGITYARPDRTQCSIEAFAAGLPPEFLEGARDPLAGTPESPQGAR